MVKTIYMKDEAVYMIDQTRLPQEEVFIECKTYTDVAKAIKDMIIRGAPAIGVAAAFGVYLGIKDMGADGFESFFTKLETVCEHLAGSRPTAVNLFWALNRMRKKARENQNGSVSDLVKLLKKEAKNIYEEDIQINKAIGDFGHTVISDGYTVLTHCNAGALATAGHGTALGVIRSASAHGKKVEVFADETRPYLQGARLTVWELQKDNIPVTLITDSMAGHFIKKGDIDAVVVGADRIAANGDVANKIGTYQVAVLAKENSIPFYVAAPTSTLDLSIATGDDIPIEERDPAEVTHIRGIQISPEGIRVKNPAFDVTPNMYVSGIITEKGIAYAPYTENLQRLFDKPL